METFPSNTHKVSFFFFSQNIRQSKIFFKIDTEIKVERVEKYVAYMY